MSRSLHLRARRLLSLTRLILPPLSLPPLCCTLSLAGCGYTWGSDPHLGSHTRARLRIEDLTGTPGLARAFERALGDQLAGCQRAHLARLSWSGADLPLSAPSAAHATLTPSALMSVIPPPTLETLTLELSLEGDLPIIVEARSPRLSAPLGAHPSIAQSGLGAGPSPLDALAALLARKAGDACASRRPLTRRAPSPVFAPPLSAPERAQ